ncbi:MAG: hypothetical protein ISR65_12580 [Bacteriovoracaceae bacterium]|nr:hypothetical protein [Bacteriovoracaceae bacterium]
MSLKKILSLLLMLSLVTCFAFAKDKEEEKDTSVNLRGEHTPAGYKIYFNKDKSSFLKVSGFTRLYYQFKDSRKLRMPYFRFYFDGQRNKRWGFHTRFDFNQSFFRSNQSKAADPKPATGIYFARAYVTYTGDNGVKVDIGRNINFLHAYDVLANYEYSVAHSIKVSHSLFGLNLALQVNYEDNAERMSTDTDKPETLILGGRVARGFKFGEKNELKIGVGAHTDYMHDHSKYVQVMPDIGFFGAHGLYIIDQFLFKRIGGVNTFENYFEVGYDIITDKLSLDLYASNAKVGKGDVTMDIGLEGFYKFTPAVTLLLKLEYSGVLEDDHKDAFAKNLAPYGFIEYVF